MNNQFNSTSNSVELGSASTQVLLDKIEQLTAQNNRLRETLELVVDTHTNGGWPGAVIVIARAALDQS